MEQAWIIMGETYLLTIVISLFVAFLIHMMTLECGNPQNTPR